MTDFVSGRPLAIAVVGMSALVPGSHDLRGFWRDVMTGQDRIRDVPDGHWSVEDFYDPDPATPDRTYARRGGFLDPVAYNPLEFGTPPGSLEATDTSQLLALVGVARLFQHAFGGPPDASTRERTGVILGTAPTELFARMAGRTQLPSWKKVMREGGLSEAEATQLCERLAATTPPWQEATFPGMLSNVVAGRVARHFDLHGPNYVTDAACASSLSALRAAVDELITGRSDLMVAGGVDPLSDAFTFMCFSKTPALSRTGDCRPFSADADGTLLGEAVVMFALKRLDDAERDKDTVYAVLRGIGASSDGRGVLDLRAHLRRPGAVRAARLRVGRLRARDGGTRRGARHRHAGG